MPVPSQDDSKEKERAKEVSTVVEKIYHEETDYEERAEESIKSIAVDFESMFYSPVGGAGCSYLP